MHSVKRNLRAFDALHRTGRNMMYVYIYLFCEPKLANAALESMTAILSDSRIAFLSTTNCTRVLSLIRHALTMDPA